VIPHVVIEPRRGWRTLELGELWRYRHLLTAFLKRDIKAGQKQTVLGVAWLVLSPLFSVAVLTLVFGRMAKIPSDGVPYPLFVFTGQIIWNAFAPAIQNATQSVVSNSHFIQKVYFPRLMIPATAAVSGIVNVGVMLVILLPFMLWYGYPPNWTIVFAAPITLGVLAVALGIGLLLAPLHVRFRDVATLTQFALQLGMYLTPVVYPTAMVPERWRPLLALNPVAGYIDAMRWAVYGGELHGTLVAVAVAETGLLVSGGALCFVRAQGRFADVI
jgi:lipopolysaccharide transport system permease protein